MSAGRVVAAACALAALAAPLPAQDRILGVEEYARELRAVESALAGADYAGASARGETLRSARVEFAGEQVAVDPALAAAVAGAGPASAQAVRVRVRAALRGLDSPATAPAAADAALLRRVRGVEQQQALPAGGQVAGMPLKPSVPKRFLDAVASAWRWIADAWDRFLRWLERLWPRRAARAPEGGAATTWTVAALVVGVALVMALLAVAALRRSAPPEAAVSQAPRASDRDADPLSREQGEWEAYAGELAAAGRAREAIRAWYHAVLVALFQSGLLHHHKGRTNWEYVARVPPQSPWRPELIALTRRFDHEWYGSERSSAESLHGCASEARSILRQVRLGAAA